MELYAETLKFSPYFFVEIITLLKQTIPVFFGEISLRVRQKER